MLRFVLLSVLFVGCYASPFPIEGRLVNGNDAKLGEIPYIVAIRFKGESQCVGSIIDSRHILAAAQCVYGACIAPLSQYMTVQYGTLNSESSGNEIDIDSAECHKDFEVFGGLRNDIAILTLKSDIPFSSTVKPIVLPKANELVPAESQAVLAGWEYNNTAGVLKGDLKRVNLKVYSAEECEGIYDKAERKYHFCAGVPEGGKGVCHGDAGSPLDVNGVVVGIVTWIYYDKPCAAAGLPGGFVNIANYVDWINSHV